jgi:hypothetical protein
MENFNQENQKIFMGLFTALKRTKSFTNYQYLKILEAQNQYFRNLEEDIAPEKQENTMDLLDDALHKFYIGTFALEQLWGVHNYLKYSDQISTELNDSALTYQQNEIVFLLSALLDQILYAFRSFLDLYLKYLVYFLTEDYIVTMSISDYSTKIENYISKNPQDERVIKINDYIKSKVFNQTLNNGDESWGDFLKSLRDKTTHQKLIKPKIIKRANKQGYEMGWPTIHDQDFSQIAQWGFGNNAYQMLKDLFPVLYKFDWIPGPYKEGMYK